MLVHMFYRLRLKLRPNQFADLRQWVGLQQSWMCSSHAFRTVWPEAKSSGYVILRDPVQWPKAQWDRMMICLSCSLHSLTLIDSMIIHDRMPCKGLGRTTFHFRNLFRALKNVNLKRHWKCTWRSSRFFYGYFIDYSELYLPASLDDEIITTKVN